MALDGFPANLRLLCSERSSVSQICREIGVNRQQFNSYLSGRSRPSSHNLLKICRYFDVAATDLELPSAEFARNRQPSMALTGAGGPNRMIGLLKQAMGTKNASMRRHVGFYHSYFQAPHDPDSIERAFISLYEEGGNFFTKSIERLDNPGRPKTFSKYEGIASFLGDKIFVVEFETLSKDTIVETILYPTYRRSLSYLYGLTFGTTSFGDRAPFSTPIVWRYLGASVDAKEALGQCGMFNADSTAINPTVRKMLRENFQLTGSATTVEREW